MQGVGFRPFIKRLADRLAIPGVVFNTGSGVVIEAEFSSHESAQRFVALIQSETPPASRIEHYACEPTPNASPFSGFRIAESVAPSPEFTLISPDLATCAECFQEMRDPTSRRFHYPFTNCTQCGPRYTITRRTPYDRANTSMESFAMCAACASEYGNVEDRRFHAEPIACPSCGPQTSTSIAVIAALLAAGGIVALKGLGGYQLACDAFRNEAVNELRRRKRRSRKPFAVMMPDLAAVESQCHLDNASRELLATAAAPIVLLPLRSDTRVSAAVAPGLQEIGVMLPYTPLHHLLFDGSLQCLVMTSGNISEEPIVISNAEARQTLGPLSDCVLTHDREIVTRVDDSVARVFEGIPRMIRRARGYAPGAIRLAREMPEVLACGAELKSTFCITKGRYAIPSQHLGDLANYETLQFFEETLQNLTAVYRATPRLIAHDLHPDYLSTNWARKCPQPKLAIQHHHAHAASCMAENELQDPVIGVVFDGTGWGEDNQIWGGEFLLARFDGYQRLAHLRYVPLPGGDRAARETWRMAAAHLHDAFGPDFRLLPLPCVARIPDPLLNMLARPTILTSSCGRLFDAISAICGISFENSYEGEAAMLLEQASAAAAESNHTYEFILDQATDPWTVDTRPMIQQIARDILADRPPREVARCFHNSVARMMKSVCEKVRDSTSINQVCLSGGVFGNWTLLSDAVPLLRAAGFEVFLHRNVPANDGGISLGQAVIGAAYLERTESYVSGDPR